MTGFLARLHCCCAIVLLAFPMAAAAQSKQPDRVVYTGVWTYEHDYQQSWKTKLANVWESRQKITIEHTYIMESNQLVSRKILWNTNGHEVVPEWETVTCSGQGELELVGLSEAEQRQKLVIPCTVKKIKDRNSSWGGLSIGGAHIARAISPPRIVGWNQLRDGCSFEEERTIVTAGGRYVTRYSVWASAVGPVVEVSKDKHGKFVPRPGAKALFQARAAVPVLFRFKLEEVSRFPGYATNANIDDAFFARASLKHLKGTGYQNDSPDLIFDPNDFKDTKVWKTSGWDQVETRKEDEEVSVAVTAMDFGAHGRLKAEVKNKKCGGWEPVPIRVDGKTRSFVTIPLDENDNLIADRMEQPNNGITTWAYAGAPGRDDDLVPMGDGTPGDGLTVFEEYRGFVGPTRTCGAGLAAERHARGKASGAIASGDSPVPEAHFRTNPAKKDLFIHSPDLLLARIARNFNEVSGLDVHLICERHYVDNDTRIVNFTLQSKGAPKRWQGKTVSQEQPQHGVHLISEDVPRLRGVSCGLGPDCLKEPWGLGPPKNVKVVKISKDKIKTSNEWQRTLPRTVFHELGHAVGIEHHGDCNIGGPVVHLDVPTCPRGFKGSVGSRVGCKITAIAVRHGENSGNAECPMKYLEWKWFVPPGHSFKSAGMVDFVYKTAGGQKVEQLPAYTGTLQQYQRHLDKPEVVGFATSTKGTGLNDSRLGPRNHAGDAWRISANQLRVNDSGAARKPERRQQCP